MQTGSTPAVSRDGFFFDGSGFGAEGEGYRGVRMSPSDLRKVLATDHARGHDKSVQCYAAQLVHYGMNPMKTKDAIKKKLLAKVNEGSLKQLRQEWETADNTRKAQATVDRPAPATRSLDQRKKQTARKSTGRRPHPGGSSRISPISVASTSPEVEDEAVWPRQMARIARWPGHTAMFEDAAEEALRTVKHSTEEIREKVSKLSKADAHALIMHLLEGVPAVGKPLHKALFSREKAGGKKIGERLNRQDWAGLYYVTNRFLFEDWGYDGPMELEIYPSSTSSHLWASFDFGMISGIMRSILRPPGMAGEKVPFEWRGREGIDEKQMSFGQDNYGYLRFYGNGLLEANMRGFGSKLRFSAVMPSTVSSDTGSAAAAGSGAAAKSLRETTVRDWKREWRSINFNNHEMEGSQRWGKSTWGRREMVDVAYASDTSVGNGKRDGPLPSFDALFVWIRAWEDSDDHGSTYEMDIDYPL
ncbi:hypothetical protein BKA70DRAFT_1398660 [Coprinopsis sp. MPI-PUGE-AT-0042]|nr:hypothetical protein BKA70DRAFT_1398660 [Coprinopsis sp. MPI-PUGE-AT-0042]